MIGACIVNDIVENLIVLKETDIPTMEKALGCEIVDARPYGLNVGDLRTPNGWTRNAGGEAVLLPLLEQEAYDSYSVAAKRAAEAESRLEEVSEQAAAEALAILNGEVEA